MAPPYGIDRLNDARKAGEIALVEEESDCHTLWVNLDAVPRHVGSQLDPLFSTTEACVSFHQLRKNRGVRFSPVVAARGPIINVERNKQRIGLWSTHYLPTISNLISLEIGKRAVLLSICGLPIRLQTSAFEKGIVRKPW